MRAGFARDDLFCVVHEIFPTDTADFADILLPATTQLEHIDVHNSYGHLYALANNRAIEPLGEALPNTEVFRRLAARMGYTEPCFADSDETIAQQAWKHDHPRAQGLDWESLSRDGFRRLAVDAAYAPFAQGNFPTPSGKCEFFNAALAARGEDPLPDYIPPRESVASNPELARRYPLAFISPPARNFLNSSFANLPSFVSEERTPWLDLHEPMRCRAGSRMAIACAYSTTAAAFSAVARVGTRARTGRGRGAVDLVAEARPRRLQCQCRHVAGAHRHGPRGDVLRLPRRGEPCVSRR